MNWNSLISTQNLKLAWRRINTGRNNQYKRFFRKAYLVYESAVDEHIKELRKALRAKHWEPRHAVRLHLPKPSGLQRPLSLLYIEDQIVLQAIANIFAKKLRKRRKRVEMETVFSNILADSNGSIFFTEQWQTTYGAFQKKCTEIYNHGLKWSAHLDLSAYYDTISHDLLLSIISPNGKDADTLETVKKWLQIWSADTIKTMTAHGIPQGPVASNFLGEIFLLPIDLKLQTNNEFQYIRYVDDIRLFGKTENEVRKAAILLEQECRGRGLIPQATKFDIRRLDSANEAIGSLPSIPPTDGKGDSEKTMGETEALKLLARTISGRPQKISNKSRFRYVMYRAPQNSEILKIAIRLLPRHPEHIDAFVAYFSNYRNRRSIAKRALDYLKSGVPYSYVRGELWHIVARLGGMEEMESGLSMAREDYKNRNQCIALSWGVMHFLMKCESTGVARARRRLAGEHPISRSLLAPIFADREFLSGGQVVTLLTGSLMEQLAGARELQERKLTLDSLNLKQIDLSKTCKIALKSLGVIHRQHKSPARDWVGEHLKSLYGCSYIPIWRKLLGTDYEHALQILIESKSRYLSAPSEWLGLQDSFNNIVIKQFFDFCKSMNLSGHSKTINKNGELVKYGSLIAAGTPFDTSYPTEAEAFRDLHRRRNRLPGQHPYDHKGGAKNKWLKSQERNRLCSKTRVSLNGIATVVKKALGKSRH